MDGLAQPAEFSAPVREIPQRLPHLPLEDAAQLAGFRLLPRGWLALVLP
jgi:hypothetical protein